MRLKKASDEPEFCLCCGQCKYTQTCTNIHIHTHETRHNTTNIFHTMSTSLWYKTGPKALNREKLSTPNWCLSIQNSENAETGLDHQLRVTLLNLSWLATDSGVTRSLQSWLLFVKLPLSKKETMQVFYRRLSECNLVDINPMSFLIKNHQ